MAGGYHDLSRPATSTPPPAVSVIVVSHDSGAPLHDCIDRVLAQDAALEVLLVDNASRDGSLDALPADPRLRLVRNAGNPGFGVACNQGARLATAPVLLFLNPDCLLPPGAVARLLDALQRSPGVGLLGAQLREADGRPQPAARRALPSVAGLLRPARDGRLAAADAAGIERVEATSGALMLVPRALFDALGGFDEGYVLHCEDLDLCRRVREAGHEVAILADLDVVHLKGQSSRRRPLWIEWQKHRGMLRYLRKFERRGIGAAAYPLLWLAVWLRYPLAAARAWWRVRS
jgi:N-acetylglucosaminyl-diphospho-decaprenol L-rhamnosyltransferase